MKHFFLGIFSGCGEIWTHKLRSLLTTICVLMGVASLVLITALINGLFANWKTYLQETGLSQKVMVMNAQPPKRQAHLAALNRGITLEDVQAIAKNASYARYVSPEYQHYFTLRHRKKSFDYTWVTGATPAILAMNNIEIAQGRFFGDLDARQAAPVIVLGAQAVEKLYEPNETVIGSQVTLNDTPFTVIGVLKKYELYQGKYNMLDEKNRYSYIPLTSMQKRILGQDTISNLNIQVDDLANVGKLTDQIENVLLATHRGVRDFRVQAFAEHFQRAQQMEAAFVLVGGGIGLITLLVGGIGIMNLMLASINERIREIGIRKALGAWNRDIFIQFLAESVVLATMGGAFGILVGSYAIHAMRNLIKGSENGFPPPIISPNAIFIGFAFSVLVGIVAGLYPAFRASRLDPIEALRYE